MHVPASVLSMMRPGLAGLGLLAAMGCEQHVAPVAIEITPGAPMAQTVVAIAKPAPPPAAVVPIADAPVAVASVEPAVATAAAPPHVHHHHARRPGVGVGIGIGSGDPNDLARQQMYMACGMG